MSELDKKLEGYALDIATSPAYKAIHGGVLSSGQVQSLTVVVERIARDIHQAFIDEGWANIHWKQEGKTVTFSLPTSRLSYMTGQEWYDKFEKEYQPWKSFISKGYNDGYADARIRALETAKKAAGIE